MHSEEKKKIPTIANICKCFKRKDGKYIISAFCLTKGIRIKKFDINKIKILINNKEYKISFKFKKGIKFLAGSRLNFYKIEIPCEDVDRFDIQNKVDVVYENYDVGKIMYNIFDYRVGRYKISKIFFQDDKSVFLRQSDHNSLIITVRDRNIYDEKKGRMKLSLGKLLSYFIFKNDILYLYEKECSRYEESASILYEKLIDLGYKNVYFIVNEDNETIKSLDEKYKHNLVYRDSLKHIIYFFKSNTFISSESIDHALQLRAYNKTILKKKHSKKLKYIFLQHGVTYMVSLDSALRSAFRKSNIKMFKIVVSSELEKKHFIEVGGFDDSDLYLCGMLKFDRAIRYPNADKIIVMPTWRRWEYNEASYDFENTKYFKMITRIVDSIPKKYHDKIVILPHPLMVAAIRNNNKFKKYLLPKGVKYDDVLKECSLLITDYSSISYDAYYRGANVIFYWEEKEECMKHYGTDLLINENTAFGDVVYNQKELESVFEQNYLKPQNDKYKKKYKKIVEFDDNKNTERLIKMLKKDGIIK